MDGKSVVIHLESLSKSLKISLKKQHTNSTVALFLYKIIIYFVCGVFLYKKKKKTVGVCVCALDVCGVSIKKLPFAVSTNGCATCEISVNDLIYGYHKLCVGEIPSQLWHWFIWLASSVYVISKERNEKNKRAYNTIELLHATWKMTIINKWK